MSDGAPSRRCLVRRGDGVAYCGAERQVLIMRSIIELSFLAAALVGTGACADESITTPPDTSSEAFQLGSGVIKQSCMVTGCSGQVCANQPVYTTCEWRDEYACYDDAICTVQANGQCGWTQTPELLACLGSGGGVGI
jgi:eight-cysteine-cluster-containing protein